MHLAYMMAVLAAVVTAISTVAAVVLPLEPQTQAAAVVVVVVLLHPAPISLAGQEFLFLDINHKV